MRNKPYIGVTGFMTRKEVSEILNYLPKGFLDNFLFMVGVLVSSKTMYGGMNKYSYKYPEIGNVKEIFLDRVGLLNLIHFCTDDAEDGVKLLSQMKEVTLLGGVNCHGLQLNVSWPDSEIIRMYKEDFQDKVVVLQIGASAMNVINNDSREFREKILSYESVVDYILIDPSGGRGMELDTEECFSYMNSVRGLNFGVGIAGGLSPSNVRNIVGDVLDKYRNWFNVDAEGQLRNKDGKLNIEIASNYVYNVYESFDKALI